VVRIEIKGDPDPVMDVSTAEAAAEFKRKRDAGVFGPRNEAERLEGQRFYSLWLSKYEDDMDYVEFCDKVQSGEIKPPAPHFWKSEKQFWFDREPSESERDLYGSTCPEKFRQAILLRHRDDGTMWYQSVTFWGLRDGHSSFEIAELKIKSAVDHVNWCSENMEPEKPVEDDVFFMECERQRKSLNGTYFELNDLEPVLVGLSPYVG
jgi:hypothetical protein